MESIGYRRVSTDEQAKEGVSLDAQEVRLRSYCAAAGVTLVEVIRDEGVSATKALSSRPGGRPCCGWSRGARFDTSSWSPGIAPSATPSAA
jgi:DNA invertase Pin-like site-specific DNA recombinase